jgi:uncharacterized protein (TIRG00374 family)
MYEKSSLFQSLRKPLKFALIGGLIVLLIKNGILSVSAVDLGRALSQWKFIIPATLTFVLAMLVGVTRLYWVLKAQSIQISWLKFFQLQMIGIFFNIALPGAVGGDLVKTFYFGKEAPGSRATAFGGILFDRFAGLAGLVLLSGLALVFGLREFLGTPVVVGIEVATGIAATGFAAFFCFLFLVPESADPLSKVLESLTLRIPRLSPLLEVYKSIGNFRNCRLLVVGVLGVSIILHLLECAGCLFLLKAFGEFQMSLVALCVAVPLAKLVSAIPVLPGGVGTGHVAFFYFFSLLGSQRGADVFTVFLLYQILFALAGGLVYLCFKETSGPLSNHSTACPALD